MPASLPGSCFPQNRVCFFLFRHLPSWDGPTRMDRWTRGGRGVVGGCWEGAAGIYGFMGCFVLSVGSNPGSASPLSSPPNPAPAACLSFPAPRGALQRSRAAGLGYPGPAFQVWGAVPDPTAHPTAGGNGAGLCVPQSHHTPGKRGWG